jgi:hypothetical protein
MAIKIDARELLEILDATPNDQNIMIVGRHGIGKSRIIAEHFAQKNTKVATFFLGQMSDPGDLIGLMYKNEATGHSEFLPPYWWPLDGEPIVLFLDEMNRARPEILQSVMDLTLNRSLAGKKLPQGSRVLSAVNEGEEYQLTDLDPALVSRFNIYHFEPTVQDWFIWADRSKLDARVIQFIQKNPTFLDGDDAKSTYKDRFENTLAKSPDRRAWERVSSLMQSIRELTDLHLKMIAGIVGMQAALLLRKSLSAMLTVTPEQVLLEFAQHKTKIKKLRLNELALLNEQIALWLNGDHYAAKDKMEIVENFGHYLLLLKSEKHNEALAHFASLLEDKKFGKVSALVLIDSPIALKVLEDFIKQVHL